MVAFMRARIPAVLGALAFSAALQGVWADTRQNPYGPIVERNAFGLKPPPPPPTDTPKEEQKPPPNVKLTGISNLFQKRAFLEITEQATPGAKPQPGQPPGPTVHRPILIENEIAYGVEIVSIDVDRNLVKIRNNGAESELTFEAPKPSGPAPGGPHPGMQQPPPGINAATGQPQPASVINSGNGQTTSSGGVTLFGGGTTAAGNNAGVTTYGGTAAVPSPLGGSESGLRTIPSRTIRTPGSPNPDQPTDPTQQAILMQAQQLRQQQQQQQMDKYRGQFPPQPPVPNFQNGNGQPQQQPQ
jgi:hypothetical protein